MCFGIYPGLFRDSYTVRRFSAAEAVRFGSGGTARSKLSAVLRGSLQHKKTAPRRGAVQYAELVRDNPSRSGKIHLTRSFSSGFRTSLFQNLTTNPVSTAAIIVLIATPSAEINRLIMNSAYRLASSFTGIRGFLSSICFPFSTFPQKNLRFRRRIIYFSCGNPITI